MTAISGHPSDPHALSLKVLRLSRPTLATQHALPTTSFPHGLVISKESSLAYASTQALTFPLTPLLTLPSNFGLAYVGETFACTLCINNELDGASTKTISGLEIAATMQSPSNQAGTALHLGKAEENMALSDDFSAGQTRQSILRQDLKEAGPHVLAVTITYNETSLTDNDQSVSRARTFRKLYQFVAQQLITVRSKVSSTKLRAGDHRRWIVEAQLENVGESSVTLESVTMEVREDLAGDSLNHEPLRHVPITLKPQDVEQMMFTITSESRDEDKTRRQLARLNVRWRGSMGEPGRLSTGWLSSKD